MRFVIITGMAGAGKSQALKNLEDMGYFCIDNMLPNLLSQFAALCSEHEDIDKVAVGIDSRSREFFNSIDASLIKLREMNIKYEVLFLDASDEVIIKRYKETRRPHPLTKQGSILQGIASERDQMNELKEQAEYIIDTTSYTPVQLREKMWQMFSDDSQSYFSISVTTFGYKRGIPLDADLVFDVRFLPNPFYIDELKGYTGLNKKVRDYIFNFKETKVFLTKLLDMVNFLVPYYAKQGKNQLVIAIGCTGGMHRSVAIANALYEELQKTHERVFIEHRDIDIEKKRLG